MRRWIGIDPGDRWTGIGILTLDGDDMYAVSGVIDGQDNIYRAVTLVRNSLDTVIRSNLSVIIEDYHVRPTGHQRFTRALAVRLIGAIEYMTTEYRVPLSFIAPGPPHEVADKMGIEKFIAKVVPQSPKQWIHAMSAWRVLALHLLAKEPMVFARLRSKSISYEMTSAWHLAGIPTFTSKKSVDLWSPPVGWRSSRGSD